jgi:prepilin-type N-terminal cleavage/methylation domain-containing protein
MPKSKKGFTLVELLVTISIMAIVTASVFGYSRQNENRNNLIRAQQRLVFELRRAQSLAMSNSQNPKDTSGNKCARWGIKFILTDGVYDSYSLQSQTCPKNLSNKCDCSVRQTPVVLENINLPNNIFIANTADTDFYGSIYFFPPEPIVEYVDNYGQDKILDDPEGLTITIKNSSQESRQVLINSIGQVIYK